MNTTDPTLPNYVRPELHAATADLTLIADLLEGTARMHERSSTYIRKWSAEEPENYDIRRRCETVFEGLGLTLSASVGQLFAKPPVMTWNASEARVAPQWDNIDAAGTKGSVLLKRFAESAIRDGLACLLTDHTPLPTGVVVTRDNERMLGLRPTVALYDRAQLINWRTAVVSNQRTLSQLTLHETAETPTGEFGVELAHRYRVLKIENGAASWTLWEQVRSPATKITDFRVVGSGFFRNRGGRVAPFLPIAIGYAGRTDAPMVVRPPLLGVAYANLAHWQQSSNLRFYRDLCAFPQPTVNGELAIDPQTGTRTQLQIGPLVAIHLEAGGTFQWTELTGESLDQVEKGVVEKREQMAQLGVAFLASEKRVAETAEAKRIDAVAQHATLSTAAQGIEDAVNLMLEHVAWYNGIDKAGAPTVQLNRDYEGTVLDAQTMGAYTALAAAGFPKLWIVRALKAGGRIPDDADEQEIIDAWDAQADTIAEEKRIAAELAAAGAQSRPAAA